MGSPTNQRRRWPGLLLLLAVFVVVAEIVTYPTESGRLDTAKNAVHNWTKSIRSPSSASPSLSTTLIFPDEEDGRCQKWLEAEDNVSYSRNFEKDPVLIAGADQVPVLAPIFYCIVQFFQCFYVGWILSSKLLYLFMILSTSRRLFLLFCLSRPLFYTS
ncbi:hypothetical protein KSP40_PGU017253 [Platanthera guangdongensis]|uniref:Uncharacterized protein n=1 Tax=Platanthera guangdongensis TaxID=2320717 RepID=A0ABR2N089_9ASPA